MGWSSCNGATIPSTIDEASFLLLTTASVVLGPRRSASGTISLRSTMSPNPPSPSRPRRFRRLRLARCTRSECVPRLSSMSYSFPCEASSGAPCSRTCPMSKSSKVRPSEPSARLPSTVSPDHPENASTSFTVACGTFSAIAPIAWLAAIRVSQLELRRYRAIRWMTLGSCATECCLAMSPICRAACCLLAGVLPVSRSFSNRSRRVPPPASAAISAALP
eukprot:1195372-Prorocentrum_minimum.AAC.12